MGINDVLADRWSELCADEPTGAALLLALKATFAEGAREILDKQGKATLPSEGYCRITQIIKPHGVLPVGRTRWYAGIASGEFPAPTKIGGASLWEVRSIRILLSEVAKGKFREVPTLSATGAIVEGRHRQRDRKAQRGSTGESLQK